MSVQTRSRSLHREAPPLIPADLSVPAAQKRALYHCGTMAPGQVHDPCQHSVIQVMCCDCAGCIYDMWSCRQEPIADSYLWWEAQAIADRFDPWVRHPYALWLYALAIIFLIASQILTLTIEVFVSVSIMVTATAAYVIGHLLF